MDSRSREIRCDGCGAIASGEHLRRRVERLELATRFRPVHIDALILYPAPPSRVEDYFYYPAKASGERSPAWRAFFDVLTAAAGLDSNPLKDEQEALEDFQRAGCFLAGCYECSLEEGETLGVNLASDFASSVVRRVQFSYKPKHIVLFSSVLRPWIHLFQAAGLGDKLILKDEGPIDIPDLADPAGQSRFQAALADALRRAISPKAVPNAV